MYRQKRFLVLLIALSLFAAACINSNSGDDEVVAEGSAEGSGDASGSADSDDDTAPTPEGVNAEMPEGEDAAVVSSVVSGAVSPEVEACVVAGAIKNPSLLATMITSGSDTDFSQLSDDDQITLLELAVECGGPELMAGYIAQGFAESSDFDAPPGMADCFAKAISDDDGSLVMAGMIAIGEEVVPAEEAKVPLVDTLTECVPASFLSSTIVTELAEDPAFVDAADTECIDAAYADDDSIRPMWVAMVDDPSAEFSELPPEVATQVFLPLFNCISFGQVVAGEAAADGLELSQTSIDCIDGEFEELGFFETILLGEEPDAASIGGIVLGCLTPEELTQFAELG